MKKLACLLGSPRPDGNSASIARRLCAAAEAKGWAVRTFALNALSYRGCQACNACKTRLDRCVLEDGLTAVLAAVAESDTLVMASPVYFGDVSAQLKGFIDRTYSYLVPGWFSARPPSRLSPGRRLAMALTQGFSSGRDFADVFPNYARFFRFYGYREAHLIRQLGEDQDGSTARRDEAFKRADEVAAALFG